MDERFISYLWFNRLFHTAQTTLMGEAVEIVSVGTPNYDAGPDVFNAKVRIGERLWVGCVEFHIYASDWHRHNHDGNPDYERTILHVTLNADEQVMTANDTPIPTIALAFPQFMLTNYERLMSSVTEQEVKTNTNLSTTRNRLPLLSPSCHAAIPNATEIALHGFYDRLLTERLEEKVAIIDQLLTLTYNNWEQTFFIILCRAMGFGTNSDAMQSMATTIPLSVIAHHRDHIEQLEALLLGQAGFLNGIKPTCKEEEVWIREYSFLNSKFSLSTPSGPQFKMARMRPASFPTMRIAQTAAILHSHDHLLRHVLECDDIKALRLIFQCRTTDYWHTHYSIGHTTTHHSSSLSSSSIDILIVNTVAPFLFLYGRSTSDYDLQERATDLLRQLPPEHNNITAQYIAAGLECRNAYDSQALLRLSRHYCQRHDCLRCYIGSLAIRMF